MDQVDNKEITHHVGKSKQLETLIGLLRDENQANDIHAKLKYLGEGSFKDSKVRNEDGELAIVWHGSPRNFDLFDTNAKGEYRWRNSGVHFSSSKELVAQYAKKAISALQTALGFIGKEEIGSDYSPKNPEHFKQAAEAYNRVIKDLIDNGEQSIYYKNHGHWSSVQYSEGNGFDMEWFGEIFGGELPTKDNSIMLQGPYGVPIYYGREIGQNYYACVLNITNPFSEDSGSIDWSFEKGEESHKDNGTDGTILSHSENVKGIGNLEIEGTTGTYSYGVFNPNQIRIVGIESNGVFSLTPHEKFDSQ